MKFKEGLLAAAIVVLVIFVAFYGINTLFPKPPYEDYCNFDNRPLTKLDVCPTVCVEMYGIEVDSCVFETCGSGCGPDNVTTFETLEECQKVLDKQNCYDEYDNALAKRLQKVFFVALPLGILIVLLGAFLFKLEPVGAGLIGGGIGTLIYGSGAFWPYTENWIRFLLSLIGLIILIGAVYWFGRKK